MRRGHPSRRPSTCRASCGATRCGAKASLSPRRDPTSRRRRAEGGGEGAVINGSKIWASHAQVADYCEMLVRTDPNADKHRGISWLIVPMDTPGIDVRPLRTMRGSSEFSEVFLDDVRVPIAN